MTQSFLGCDRGQAFLLPPSVDEWLPADHFARFVISAVEAMDLTAFYAGYRADGFGRPAHDPSMMVALLVYAYARGKRSSRVIEHGCLEDIAFRVIAANRVPDHCTIARFRQGHETALAELFGEVLTLCSDAGLAGVEVLAVDGTKVHANASERATRDYQQLAEEILHEADAVDAAEDEQFGERRGDELPPELSTANGRRKWLDAAKRRLDAQREQEARPIPAPRRARVKEAKRRLEEELWTEQRANDAYEAYRARGVMRDGRRFGSPAKPYTPPQQPVGKINVTDPDSRNVKTPRGYVQGYNAQAVCNEHQIVGAAEVSVSSADFGQMGPMITNAESELARAGVTAPLGVVLADAGYWHGEQIDELMGRGIQVLVPPDASKRKGARPGWNGGRYAFMRRVLQTDTGGDLYRKRQQNRTHLCRHQVQPPHRPLPAPRPLSRALRMATDHRQRQPHEAAPPPAQTRQHLNRELRRTRPGSARTARPRPQRALPATAAASARPRFHAALRRAHASFATASMRLSSASRAGRVSQPRGSDTCGMRVGHATAAYETAAFARAPAGPLHRPAPLTTKISNGIVPSPTLCGRSATGIPGAWR